MTMIALCSAKGSPGVTVTALALTLTASRPVVLAECDPVGGDITAGYLREVPLAERGIGQLTTSLHRGTLAEDAWGQLVDLAPAPATALTRLLLPGLADPQQAVRWAETRRPGDRAGWAQLADVLTRSETATAYDVIADCGRLSAAHPPSAILAAADRVLLVVRPELPSMRAAAVALAGLRTEGGPSVSLIVIGDRPYGRREIAEHLGVEIAAQLPVDAATARALSLGGGHPRGQLLRAAARAQAAVWPNTHPTSGVPRQIEATHAQ